MQTIEVYYDGLCQLCSREVNLIRRLAPVGQMVFTDIMAGGFHAEAQGFDPLAVHRHMHFRDGDGNLRIGLDALIAMWRPVPYFRLLACFAGLPGIHRMSLFGYSAFARVRLWLPRRRCSSGECQAGKIGD